MAEVKVIEHLEDCFENEEERKYWHSLRYEAENEALIRRIKRDAFEWQVRYRGCGQTCLNALQRNLGIGNIESLKAASSFGGGSGGVHLCGNLAAGCMALGMELGRADFMEPGGPREPGESNYTRTRELRNELRQRFREEFGSEICQEIQERHFGRYFIPYADLLKNPKDRKLLESGEVYDILSTYASKISAKAAGIAAEIILRERRKLKEKEH